MDASFYFVHTADNSQDIGDQIVPTSKVTLNPSQHGATQLEGKPTSDVSAIFRFNSFNCHFGKYATPVYPHPPTPPLLRNVCYVIEKFLLVLQFLETKVRV